MEERRFLQLQLRTQSAEFAANVSGAFSESPSEVVV